MRIHYFLYEEYLRVFLHNLYIVTGVSYYSYYRGQMEKQMTDTEAWDVVTSKDCTRLIRYFLSYGNNALAYSYLEDAIMEARLRLFKYVKSGYLDRGSVAQVVKYAVQNTIRTLRSTYAGSVYIPAHAISGTAEEIYQRAQLEKDYTEKEALYRVLRQTVLFSTDYVIELGDLDKAMPSDGYHYYETSDKGIERFENKEYITRAIEEAIRVRAFSSNKLDENVEEYVAKCFYCFARYYELEETIYKLRPELFNEEPYNLKVLIDREPEEWELKPPTLTDIGKHIGLTRERVRQIVSTIAQDIRNYIEV